MSPAPDTPAPPSRVAFLGFSDAERHALATCLRLSADREPRYAMVYTLTDADFLVADADHAPSVQLVEVTERLAETVFVGGRAPEGASPVLRRPIDALQVLVALDGLQRPTPAAAAPSAPAARALPPVTTARPPLVPDDGVIVQSMRRAAPLQPPPQVTSASMPLDIEIDLERPAAASGPVSYPPVAPPAAPRARSGPLARAPAPSALRSSVLRTPTPAAPARPVIVGPPAPPSALLVDDSAIALRYLASRLTPWGLRIDTAPDSVQALQQLSQRRYDLVFLDLELGAESELDGLALCHHIKREGLAPDASVVMVSAHHSEIDRARGALAGCDGYLAKPLKGGELAALLRRHRLSLSAGGSAEPADLAR